MTQHIVVVGAGAAGLMAAGRAAELGARVTLLEKMSEAGKKLLITGQERCNLTNAAPLREFLEHYGRNGRFLHNAYHRFFREELLTFLEHHGVLTREERGGRIFPASDRAKDVRDALLRYARRHGVQIRYEAPVQRLLVREGAVQGVTLRTGERVTADAVILATGGASWPATGSTGDGYRMALDVGHTVVPLRPALVPLTVVERTQAKALQGVSLRNVRCDFFTQEGEAAPQSLPIPYPMPPVGEMGFTHFGVSGPLILTASLAVVDALRAGQAVTLAIDLKPGMTPDEVEARLQHEFEARSQRHLPALLRRWVPRTLADVLAELSGVTADRPVHTIRAEERAVIAGLLKGFRWQISGSLPLASGMVTAGGVALDEVDPVSFESRRVAGLHIVGEMLDLAADTGGFNLQAAFSSGYLAGEGAATP
jgi:hypothetical protein